MQDVENCAPRISWPTPLKVFVDYFLPLLVHEQF